MSGVHLLSAVLLLRRHCQQMRRIAYVTTVHSMSHIAILQRLYTYRCENYIIHAGSFNTHDRQEFSHPISGPIQME
jgi:hypothetical protein